MTRLQSSVFSGRTLAVVFVANGNPGNTLGFVVTSDIRNTTPVSGQLVLDLVGGIVLNIDSSALFK